MDDNIRPISSQDIFLWPDGSFCYRCDAVYFTHMSDDYEVIPYGTTRHATFDEEIA